jgi:hypothetical protein
MVRMNVKQGDDMLVCLGLHCKKLLSIKQSLEKKSLNSLEVIREIKIYVMREEGHSISKLDRCFDSDTLKRQIRQLVTL